MLATRTLPDAARRRREPQRSLTLLSVAGFALSVSLIPCLDRSCRPRRDFLRMLRTLIWPLAFAAMDDAGAAAFGAWQHVKSVSDIAATAIVTDHAWSQNLDSGDGCEPVMTNTPPPREATRFFIGPCPCPRPPARALDDAGPFSLDKRA
jgi:hypothetical protein